MSPNPYTIEHFWREIYARTGLSEERVPPRDLSHLLDQAQRFIFNAMTEEELHEFVRPVELDLDINDGYYAADGDMVAVELKGTDNSKYYGSDGDYIDSEGSLARELGDVIAVAFAEDRDDDGIRLHYGEKVPFEEMARYNTEDSFDYYIDQAEQGYKWCYAGGKLYLWPRDHVETGNGSANNLRIWASWYPERFIDGLGLTKSEWTNDAINCEMPSKYFPLMTDWVVRKLLVATGNADLLQAAMQDTQIGIQTSREKAAAGEAGPWIGQK